MNIPPPNLFNIENMIKKDIINKYKILFKKILLKAYIGICKFLGISKYYFKDNYINLRENLSNPRRLFTISVEELLKLFIGTLFNAKLVFTILLGFCLYSLKKNTSGALYLKDLNQIPYYIGAIFLVRFLLRFFTTKRRVKEDIEFPLKHIRSISNGLFNIDVNDIQHSNFKIAELSDAEVTAKINMAAFAGGIWETKLTNKLARNKAHIEKNKLSIVLIKANDNYIGFTHVLPVNRRVWNRYTAGKFVDNKFYDSHIIAEDYNPKHERPYGLIYFSAVIPFWSDLNSKITEEILKHKGELLEQCTAYHFNLFLNSMFKNKNRVKVLFNNYDDLIYRPFEKEAINDRVMISGEKAPIYIFQITNK